jgi:hypothetical protein
LLCCVWCGCIFFAFECSSGARAQLANKAALVLGPWLLQIKNSHPSPSRPPPQRPQCRPYPRFININANAAFTTLC